MVCQNQSIDDSDAPLARDLRLLVRDRLKAGDSDSQVLAFLVARYGEFVLMRPVMSWRNALLWGTPVLVLLLGIGATRGRAAAPARRRQGTGGAHAGGRGAGCRRCSPPRRTRTGANPHRGGG